MAKPIKETPILTGQDARNFINQNKFVIKESDKDKKKIQEVYQAFLKISKF